MTHPRLFGELLLCAGLLCQVGPSPTWSWSKCQGVIADSAGEEDEHREARSPPKVTQPASPGTFTLTWGDSLGRVELPGQGSPPRSVFGRPSTDPGRRASYPFPVLYPNSACSSVAPSGPPTVTDYPRVPGDKGGNIWILLHGLAGGLGAGGAEAAQHRA